MENFGITSYTGGNHLSNLGGSYQPLDSFVKSLVLLFRGGKVLEAEETIRIAKINATSQEREKIIESLTQIAVNTSDDGIRMQMFYSIWQLGCTWQ